jgi:hypothetical protein
MGSKTELMLERENERTGEDGKTRGTSMIWPRVQISRDLGDLSGQTFRSGHESHDHIVILLMIVCDGIFIMQLASLRSYPF